MLPDAGDECVLEAPVLPARDGRQCACRNPLVRAADLRYFGPSALADNPADAKLGSRPKRPDTSGSRALPNARDRGFGTQFARPAGDTRERAMMSKRHRWDYAKQFWARH